MSGASDPPLSPELLQRALDSSAQAVVVTDTTGIVVYWNAAATDLYGYSAAEALGRRGRDLIGSSTEAAATETALAAIRSGTPYVGEWEARHRDGHGVPVFVTTTAVCDAAGEATHLISAATDARPFQRAARNAQLLVSIVEGSVDAILSADLDGTITSANAAAGELFGCDAADLVGRPCADFCPADGRWSQSDRVARAAGGARVGPVETMLRRENGSSLDLSVTLAPISGDGGEVVGISAILRDTTLQRRAARQLAHNAALFEARFAQSSMPQALLDLDGRISAVNDAYCLLVGYGRPQLLGRHDGEFAHADDDGAAAGELATLQAGEQDSATFERVLRHRDGQAVNVLVDVTTVRHVDGEAYGFAVFALDRTAVRQVERRLAEQEALFRAISMRASDLAIVADADANIVYASPSVTEMFGYTPEQLVMMLGYEFVHPQDVDRVREIVESVVAEPESSARFVCRIRDAAGRWRWVEETVTNCLTDPAIGGLVANLRDVTETVAAEQALRASEQRHRAIAETAEEGIFALTPEGQTLFANAKMAQLLGCSLSTLYERGLLELVDTDTAKLLARKLATRAETGAEKYELPYDHPDGTVRLLAISATPLRDDADAIIGSLAMVSDVTEARRVEEELREHALRDGLTGLANRALLTDRIDQAIARRRRATPAGSVAVLFLDLDQFKLVNDSFGHAAGDRLLVEVAARVQHVVRPGDTVARFAGDEFAVVCEDIDEPAAVALARRILDALAAPFDIASERVYVAAHIGVALSPPHSADALLRYADTAMHEAKTGAAAEVRVFDMELAERSYRDLALATDVREALTASEFELMFQPIVQLETGQLIGVEALLRWTHPRLGDVSPTQIVRVAEDVGLAPKLDEWVLRQACAHASRMRSDGVLPADAYVAVNISARTVSAVPLDEIVDRVLAETGLPADVLMLEVTEGAVVRDADAAIELLHRLRERGVRVAIDDFGTGYSSLSYLSRFPVSLLKIDRSFVESVTTDSEAFAIAASIVDLARAIGVTAVAEGVETAEQAEVLRRLSCDAAQGYLWSAPVPSDALDRHLVVSRTGAITVACADAVPVQRRGGQLTSAHGLRRMMRLHQDGASPTTIAAALNAEGFRTPDGLRWHRTSVARAIRSEVYTGLGRTSIDLDDGATMVG